MKFIKIPYDQGTGYRLINLDQIESVDVNTKSNIGQILMQSGQKIVVNQFSIREILTTLSKRNYLTEHYLSLGLAEITTKEEF